MEPLQHLPIPLWTPELEALFLKQGQLIETPSGCLVWSGGVFRSGGYGCFYVPSGEVGKAGRSYRAHRVMYAWRKGDPGEAIVDHLCHDPTLCFTTDNYCEHRRCVNIDHLGLTDRGENVRRGLPGSPLWHPDGNSNKILSSSGQKLDYVDPRGWRSSRADRAAAVARHYARNRDEINAKKREARRAKGELVAHQPRPCRVCGRIFVPLRVSATRGFLCPEPDKSDEVAHRAWRDCVNLRQNENRRRRLDQ